MQPTDHQPDEQPHTPEAGEWYERGLALRKAGLFNKAIEQLQKAGEDPAYRLKSYAQIGLCYKSSNYYEEAVTAFRHALESPAASSKETVQILYMLGRTLESLNRPNEALEAYRWLRRENPHFRDVGERIESISTSRKPGKPSDGQASGSWPKLHAWHGLLRNTR